MYFDDNDSFTPDPWEAPGREQAPNAPPGYTVPTGRGEEPAPPTPTPTPTPTPNTPAPGPTPPLATDDPYGLVDHFGAPHLPNLADFKSPDPLKPWEEQFNAPTAEDAINSPGFQFRLGEGLKALERSAAAKGTLLTGGTMKGLTDYSQNKASEEYGNVYNRAYNEYDTKRQNFLQNEANRYNSQRSNLNDQWGINSDYFNMGRVNRLDDFNIFDTSRKYNFGVMDSNRNFGRNLNNDFFSNYLNLSLLGRPPAPNA